MLKMFCEKRKEKHWHFLYGKEVCFVVWRNKGIF